METVGIVGLGLLGHALAARFLGGGQAVVGYDVVPARLDALAHLGGHPVGSVKEVANAAEGICVVLPSLATVEDVVLGPTGLVPLGRPGQTIIQMSTISTALTERLAHAAGRAGLRFLDCPVSGTSASVAAGRGIFFVGGERADFERWKPVLEAALPQAFYIGAAGKGTFLKLIANLLVGLHSAAAAEALLMARKAGLDPNLALSVLRVSAAASQMLDVRGPLIARDEFPAQMKLELFMKDLHLIQQAAAAVGAPLPLTDVAERLYAAAQAGGHGPEDLSVVVRALEKTPPSG